MSRNKKEPNLENQLNEESSFIPETKLEETQEVKPVVKPKLQDKKKSEKKKPSTKLTIPKKNHKRFSHIKPVDGVRFE
jgi:hypothetical protein